MKYFKVKYGFEHDEFISVSEKELPMAIRAHVTGKKGLFEEGAVSGDKIIAIVPDYNRLMGWKRSYQLTGEDYDEIGPKTQREYTNLLQETSHQANLQLSGNTPKRLN